jgi:hypothetical protein
MLHARPRSALGAIGEIAGFRRRRLDDLAAALLATFVEHEFLRAMQQLGQGMLVVHLGAGDHGALLAGPEPPNLCVMSTPTTAEAMARNQCI